MPADRRHAARLQGVLLNTARVMAISDAATLSETIEVKVDEAVTGDLIAMSPSLAAKLAEIDGRIEDLEAV
ncbi:hypothetical protein [Sphingomonas alpina]|uniref:Uncharacterized protein n=1 Tax=Sphingomonas alpina TaxID=653931 RepID=A0A7H0LHT0_9SPHN|nr:hypothetical protein [Sphingomonas alpina]QNQ09233.1 hypothetical protein H3Z74_21605 [Sphingomonas alpina]